MADEKNTQFNYLLNAVMHAAQEAHPAKAGYAGKYRALIAHVRELERKAALYDAEHKDGVQEAPKLDWCQWCGEGVTTLCRGALTPCPKGLAKATADGVTASGRRAPKKDCPYCLGSGTSQVLENGKHVDSRCSCTSGVKEDQRG